MNPEYTNSKYPTILAHFRGQHVYVYTELGEDGAQLEGWVVDIADGYLFLKNEQDDQSANMIVSMSDVMLVATVEEEVSGLKSLPGGKVLPHSSPS